VLKRHARTAVALSDHGVAPHAVENSMRNAYTAFTTRLPSADKVADGDYEVLEVAASPERPSNVSGLQVTDVDSQRRLVQARHLDQRHLAESRVEAAGFELLASGSFLGNLAGPRQADA